MCKAGRGLQRSEPAYGTRKRAPIVKSFMLERICRRLTLGFVGILALILMLVSTVFCIYKRVGLSYESYFK